MLHRADSLGSSLDELIAHLNDTIDSLREVEYRSTVLRLTASADDRSQMEGAIEQLALALADHRSCAATLDKFSQRVAQALQFGSSEQSLATCAERAPEQWRYKLAKGMTHLRRIAERTRQELRQAESASRSNLNLTETTISGLIGPDATVEPLITEAQVTYDAAGLRTNRPRLLDGRI